MRRRRAMFRRGGGRRPPSSWIVAPQIGGTLAVAGSALLELVGTTTASGYDPPTIERFSCIRVVGEIHVSLPLGLAAAQASVLWAGIYATNVPSGTAFWDPRISNAAATNSWMWRRSWMLVGSMGASVNNDLCGGNSVHVDIPVKRVLRDQMGVYLSLFHQAIVGEGSITFVTNLRTLIKRVA